MNQRRSVEAPYKAWLCGQSSDELPPNLLISCRSAQPETARSVVLGVRGVCPSRTGQGTRGVALGQDGTQAVPGGKRGRFFLIGTGGGAWFVEERRKQFVHCARVGGGHSGCQCPHSSTGWARREPRVWAVLPAAAQEGRRGSLPSRYSVSKVLAVRRARRGQMFPGAELLELSRGVQGSPPSVPGDRLPCPPHP